MKEIRPIDIVLTLALGICIYFLWDRGNQKPDWALNNYKTDSIQAHYHYHLPKDTSGIVVNPRFVVNYQQADLSHLYIKFQDSLLRVVDSLNKTVTTINQDYLKNFPNANKLITGTFKKDSMQLDLLGIDGKIKSLIYPVNYLAYEYKYVNGNIKASPITGSKNQNPQKISHRFTIYGGYDLAWKSTLTSAEYNVEYKRVNLSLEPTLYVQKNPQLFLQGKLGYRIK